MRKLNLITTILIISGAVNFQLKAQTSYAPGIHFEKELSWEQILNKAKTEHKYIFVDCYATWCGPCKWMDNTVYNETEVGEAYNKDFISVKVQMNKTEADDEQAKSWYSNAEMLTRSYTVDAYPTFLFFDTEGKPIHKVTGAMDSKAFIQLAADVRDTAKQYYNVLKYFKPNTLDIAEEKRLINLLKTSDQQLAGRIAADYLSRLPQNQLRSIDDGRLMVLFQDNPQVTDIAATYIKHRLTEVNLKLVDALSKQPKVEEVITNYVAHFDKKQFADENNRQFIIHFLRYAGVKKAVASYIGQMNNNEIGEETNLTFISRFMDDSTVQKIAKKYIGQLADKNIYTKPMLNFIAAFTQTTVDRGFIIFYKHAAKVNKVIGRNDFARNQVMFAVTKSEFDPMFTVAKQNDSEPDWTKLSAKVIRKYSANIAAMVVANSKVNWYFYKSHYRLDGPYAPELMTALINKAQLLRDDTVAFNDFHLNDVCYWVFNHSDNKEQLETATGFMQQIAARNPNNTGWLDTYACLLYKTGKTTEAIDLYQKILVLSEKQENRFMTEHAALAINKIKKGEAIWEEKEFQ